MNRLSKEDRVRVVAALVEGCSIRSTVRMTGVAKNTVTKLLIDLGKACMLYHHEKVRNVRSARVQCDEIWTFCYAKQKNLPPHLRGRRGYGDVWTWVGMDADSKLVISWLLGDRDAANAEWFMHDLAKRLANKVQLTTDGYKVYLEAVEGAFGGEIDFAMLQKLYGSEPEAEKRYSPAKCIGVKVDQICGSPDPAHISTSFCERQNLTMRMGMRRFTRLTNGFSKKAENLSYALAIHFVYYNFCRIHQTLRRPPAMVAGLTKTLWEIEDMVALLD